MLIRFGYHMPRFLLNAIWLLALLAMMCWARAARAQGNYEVPYSHQRSEEVNVAPVEVEQIEKVTLTVQDEKSVATTIDKSAVGPGAARQRPE